MSEHGDCLTCGRAIEVPWMMVKLCESCLDEALVDAEKAKAERTVRANAAKLTKAAMKAAATR